MFKGKIEGKLLNFFDKNSGNLPIKCCKDMVFHIAHKEIHFSYLDRTREYVIHYMDIFGENSVQIVNFCPWCGAKLPKSLRDEYFDIIYDELGMDDEFDPNLPEEFKSDEWWKKRGL
ncbi:hypothetical protein NOVO_09075 [Rickettsiales bacterium Ac37b]|nr:hypothetical protein NOVO_09075 [Rickettsiales bacterium Ac37b]